jgi:phosphate transport system permease protein
VASIPLFSVLYMLIVRGGSRLSWEVLVELPSGRLRDGGGFGNAIAGTLVMVGLGASSACRSASGRVFLAELGPTARCQRRRFAPRP